MTKDEAIKMAKAKLECLERSTSGLWEKCNNDCENCNMNYDQGNTGEQKEWLKFTIKAMEQEPIYFPPCVDCNTKMNEIREAYDKLKDQEPCEDAVSRQAARDTIFVECSGEKLDIDFAKVLLLQRAIKALPSVTPKRKVGKWIYSGSYDVEGMLYCSNCNNEIDVSEGHFNYCPNCGAEMRGGEE